MSPNNILKCLHNQKLDVQFGQIKQLYFFPHISPGKKGKKNLYQVILPVLISFLPKQCSHPCHFHHLRSEPDSWPVTAAAAASRWSSSHTASPHCLIAGVHMRSVSPRLLPKHQLRAFLVSQGDRKREWPVQRGGGGSTDDL